MKNNKRAHLIFTLSCNNSCLKCIYKNIDFDKVKHVSFSELCEYNEVIISGGEPMLYYDRLLSLGAVLRLYSVHVILHTSYHKFTLESLKIIVDKFDGITLTIHDKSELKSFERERLNEISGTTAELCLKSFVGLNPDMDFGIWCAEKIEPPDELLLLDGEELVICEDVVLFGV